MLLSVCVNLKGGRKIGEGLMPTMCCYDCCYVCLNDVATMLGPIVATSCATISAPLFLLKTKQCGQELMPTIVLPFVAPIVLFGFRTA